MGVFVEYHLVVWCQVRLFREIVFHPRQTLLEHLWSDVGIVGAVEQMVGRGDGEQHADDLGRVCPCKVVVEGSEVGFVVNLTHHLVGLHHRCQ